MIHINNNDFAVTNVADVIYKLALSKDLPIIEMSCNHEGPDLEIVMPLIRETCAALNIPLSKIILYTANRVATSTELTVKVDNNLHWLIRSRKAMSMYNVGSKEITKKFGLYYGRPAWDRLLYIEHVITNNISSDKRINISLKESEYNRVFTDELIMRMPPAHTAKILRFVSDHYTGIFDSEAIPLDKEQFNAYDILPLYKNVFIDVVSETYLNGSTWFPTEKTFRPIYAMTPFIVSGPIHYLRGLRDTLGLKTFSEFWDESYDDFWNYERAVKICSLIDELNSYSLSDMKQLYKDMLPVLEYNYKKLFGNVKI